jgi:short-subunit dehydrogenase
MQACYRSLDVAISNGVRKSLEYVRLKAGSITSATQVCWKDKVVMITGGSNGVGAALAEEVTRRGAHVCIVDLVPPKGSSHRLFLAGDITDADFRTHCIDEVLARFGTIDVLINNAGVGLYAAASSAPLHLVRRMFDVNVFAPLAFSQLVVPLFKENGKGLIINIGSIGGEVALPWAALYCATKFSLHCISDSLRRELQGTNIKVLTVKPGVVATAFREEVLGGVAPPRVKAITGMRVASLAQAIANRVEGGGNSLFKPWYGWIFALTDRVAPFITDRYIQGRWAGSDESAEGEFHRVPGES